MYWMYQWAIAASDSTATLSVPSATLRVPDATTRDLLVPASACPMAAMAASSVAQAAAYFEKS